MFRLEVDSKGVARVRLLSIISKTVGFPKTVQRLMCISSVVWPSVAGGSKDANLRTLTVILLMDCC